MPFLVEGTAYEFREATKARSAFLRECQAAVGPGAEQADIVVPFERQWVEAYEDYTSTGGKVDRTKGFQTLLGALKARLVVQA